jgi:hypothetical protein
MVLAPLPVDAICKRMTIHVINVSIVAARCLVSLVVAQIARLTVPIPEHLTAPADLVGEGLDLYNAIIEELDDDDMEPSAHELHLLVSAARCAQLAERIERELAESDLLIDGYRGQRRASPLLGELSTLRRTTAVLLRQLFPANRSDIAKNAAAARWSSR